MSKSNQNNKSSGKPEYKGKTGKYSNPNKNADTRSKGTSDGSNSAYTQTVDKMRSAGQNIRDASAWNYSDMQGAPLSFKWGGVSTTQYVPGICLIKYAPSIGIATSYNDPVNSAMRSIWGKIRYQNMHNVSYAAPDLGLHIHAIDSASQAYKEFVKVYGDLQQFTAANRYIPKALLQARGYDYDELLTHIADLREFLNTWARDMRTWFMPDNIPMFHEHDLYTSCHWLDSQTLRAQIYTFAPEYFWIYDQTSSTTGGMLKKYTIPTNASGKIGFEQIRTTLNALKAAMSASQDANAMNADLLAYMGTGMEMFQTVPSEYTTPYNYSVNVLNAIHNMTILSTPVGETANVTQENNYLKFNPTFELASTFRMTAYASQYLDRDVMLDQIVDSPTAVDNMFASTFCTTMQPLDQIEHLRQYKATVLNTLFVTGVKMFVFSDTHNDGGLMAASFSQYLNLYGDETGDPDYSMPIALLLAQQMSFNCFSYRPLRYIALSNSPGLVFDGALNMFLVISDNELIKVNRYMLANSYGLPES